MRSRFRGSATALAGLVLLLALASAAIPAASAAPQTISGGQPQSARQVVGGQQLASPGTVVRYPARGARKLPRVPASAFVIADASTGQVLAAKDAHGLFPPASTLKILTAITLIPRLNPNAMVVATRQATSVQPNVVGLIAGHSYRAADLFQALLLISANDAAVSLVQATGSFDRGMGLLNAEAHRLQAYDVVAKTPNGLPAAGQVVSAYDEALIARQALTIPAFMKYDSTLAARFKVKKRKWVTLVNQNTLLTSYRGGIGGKIGWTVKSEATYVGLARRGGVTLIVTLLHCAPLREIISGERLLNWGFAMAGKVTPVGVLVRPLPGVGVASGHAQASHTQASRAQASRAQASRANRAPGGSGPPPRLLVIATVLIAAVAAGLGLAHVAWSRRRSAGSGRPPLP